MVIITYACNGDATSRSARLKGGSPPTATLGLPVVRSESYGVVAGPAHRETGEEQNYSKQPLLIFGTELFCLSLAQGLLRLGTARLAITVYTGIRTCTNTVRYYRTVPYPYMYQYRTTVPYRRVGLELNTCTVPYRCQHM